MKRVIVGIDGSSSSIHAFRWATDLASCAVLEVIAARVSEGLSRSLTGQSNHQDRASDMEELCSWCARVDPNWEQRHGIVLSADPPEALVSVATLGSADMLVVGSRGSGGFANLRVGSVAHHLLHLIHVTTVPLAVVPFGAPTRITRLVVGTDGSAGAARAVDFTAHLAELLRVPVTVVHSYEPSSMFQGRAESGDWRARAENEVRGWALPIEKAGIELDVFVDPDPDVHPVVAIENTLEAHLGSVAVLGTRGLGGFSGLRLGRVPLQLVNHSDDSVIVVPPFS
jgi:nucleotide-binding universal stress UspA family protein